MPSQILIDKAVAEIFAHPIAGELDLSEEEVRQHAACWHYRVLGPAKLARYVLASRWVEEVE